MPNTRSAEVADSRKYLTVPRITCLHLLLLLAVSVPFLIYGGVVTFHPDIISQKSGRLVIDPYSPFWINYNKVSYFDYPPGFFQVHGFAGSLFGGLEIFELDQRFARYASVGFFVNYVFSLLGVVSTYFLSKTLSRSSGFALLSALMLLTAPLWVADSHMLTVDVAGVALCVLAAFLALKFHDDGRPEYLFLSSIVCGFVAAVKYPLGLVVLAPLLAILFEASSPIQKFSQFIRVGLCSFVAFIVLCIPILLNFPDFLDDFSRLIRKAAVDGHFGFTTQNAFYHFGIAVPSQGLGPYLYGLGLAGALLAVIRNPKRNIIILIFPTAFFIMIGSNYFSFYRYYMPIMPFIFIYATDLAAYLMRKAVGKLALLQGLVILSILIAPMIINARASLRHNTILNQGDLRTIASEFLTSGNIEARICFWGRYSREIRGKTIHSCKGDLDGIAFDSFSHERYIYENREVQPLFGDILEKAYKIIYFNPYSVSKNLVKYQQKNLYSPWHDEMYVRKFAGPYIEIYLMKTEKAEKLVQLCQNTSACGVLDVPEGYFRNRLRFGRKNN